MKNITLKTNDVTNIVHRYYFHTQNTRTEKKTHIFVTTSFGLPYCLIDFITHTKQGAFSLPAASNTQIVVRVCN
jgi:hypothetical protein